MNSVLITGANRGIGLTFAQHYAKAGWKVFACCRNPKNATALIKIVDAYDLVTLHMLDVMDKNQIKALAQELKNESIDILLNNAGYYGADSGGRFGHLDEEEWIKVFRINTIAPLMMAQAFVSNVAKSDRKLIAILSTRMASISENISGGSYMYRSSKAALNQAMKSLSIDVCDQDIAVVALHPGWVRTDMGGLNALIDTTTSVSGLARVLEKMTLARTGMFVNYDGSSIPW